MSETTRTRLYTFALLAVFIYGVTPVFTKVGTLTADGITVGALRAVIAAPVAALVIALAGCRIPLRRDALFLVLVSGLGGLVLFPVFFSWGVQFTTAGHAAAGTAAGAVMAGAIMAVLHRKMPGWRWWVGVAICSLGWGTTILAYLLWNRALADGGVARIGALQLLQPVIGIGLAPVILGEPLTPILLAATLVILVGVALVQRGDR